jgi:hypothetical protein
MIDDQAYRLVLEQRLVWVGGTVIAVLVGIRFGVNAGVPAMVIAYVGSKIFATLRAQKRR